MSYELDILRFGIKHLLFNGEYRTAFEKYVLLEKLLLTLDDSDIYNAGTFDKFDTQKLIDFYTKHETKFISNLRSLYIRYCQESGDTFDRANFNKMNKPKEVSSRKPNKHLLSTLVDILIKGYLDEEDGQYYFVEPLENFSDYNSSSPHQYIGFCKAISTITKEPFKPYKIKYGNDIISKLTSDDLPLIKNILKQKVYISKYEPSIKHISDELDAEDSYMQMGIEELYAPLPWELPRLTLSNYEDFDKLLSENIYLTDVLPNISDGLLIWLCNFCNKIYLSQDKFFHQLLFLLSFVSEKRLDEYIKYIPSHTLNVSISKISGYYTDIQRISCLPSIDGFFLYYNDTSAKIFHQKILNNFYISTDVPVWSLFALCHLSNKQLQAAKNLYITLVLRKRYHPQKDNDSFPSELLDMLRKEVSNIDFIYTICN